MPPPPGEDAVKNASKVEGGGAADLATPSRWSTRRTTREREARLSPIRARGAGVVSRSRPVRALSLIHI
eukprot:5307691-Prymnesium_polylepis.1